MRLQKKPVIIQYSCQNSKQIDPCPGLSIADVPLVPVCSQLLLRDPVPIPAAAWRWGWGLLASRALTHMSWSSQAQLSEDREARTWRLLFPLEQPRCSDQKLCQAAGHSQECAVGKQDPFQIWLGTKDEEMQKVDSGCIHEMPGAG